MTLGAAIRASLNLLERRDRWMLGIALSMQIATALLDLLGVALIGLVSTLSLAAIQGQEPPRAVNAILSRLGIVDMTGGTVLAVLAGAAAALLLAKDVVGPLLISRIFAFLARRQADFSGRLSRELLSRPLTFVQQRSSQETAAALLAGCGAATAVLGQSLAVASEISLLTLLSVGLLFVDPMVAVGAIIYFVLFGLALQKILGHRASQSGKQNVRAEIASQRAVHEAIGAYREISVSDRRSFYVDRIQELRGEVAQAQARVQVYGMLPKYATEGAVVIGASSLAAVLFATRPVAIAAGTFVLFLAAATRVIPSLLRLSSAALAIRAQSAIAAPTFALAADLGESSEAPRASRTTEAIQQALQSGHADFVPRIEMQEVTFTYPHARSAALRGISMVIEQGQSLALVGRSGAGKSTLADVILGVLEPDTGTVTLGGIRPTAAVRQWPGGIAYVPQDVMLANDTVRANVALGLPRGAIDEELVWDALRRAHLADYVRADPAGLDALIGERGLRFSGGQRQRLGIARALFTRPRLLVLDEATSALDAETEQAITAMLDELGEDVTTVIIAHRLSTIRNVDIVMYMKDGKAVASGTFDDVCARVPALQRQAELMGLQTAPMAEHRIEAT
jgi:ABC-type multidrug transport system fused ATPase/permease subunit